MRTARRDRFRRQMERHVARRLRARRKGKQRQFWAGLGMLGLVGWSVAVPMVAGALLGGWLDERWPAPFSWTLALLLAGLVVGCANAWYWMGRERETIQEESEDA